MIFEIQRSVTIGIVGIDHVMTVALVAEVSYLYRAGILLSVAWYALSNH